MEKDYKENFELWASDCVKINDKRTGARVPFILNKAQKRVLGELESMRLSGKPIRLIILKARQWGASTLVETYLAWMQLMRHTGWNSIVCAHVKDASAGIKGMYSRLLQDYPDRMKTGEKKDWRFAPFEKSQWINEIPSRGCTVTIATALSPNSARSLNLSMAHLSEVAFWGDGDDRIAEDIVRTVSGSIVREPETVVIMESTANGKNNYFYKEWMRAVNGESDKRAIFVPWHEIELYRLPLTESERKRVEERADEYERGLLAGGIPAESVAWYHEKRREYPNHEAMMSEFPSTAEEAFAESSESRLIEREKVGKLREKGSTQPNLCIGVITGREQTISLYGEDDGVLVPLQDEEYSLSSGEFADYIDKRSRGEGIRVALADSTSPGERSHGDYLSERVSRSGVNLITDEDEGILFRPSPSDIVHYADVYMELSSERKICETDATVSEKLKGTGVVSAQKEGLVLSRLLAAYIYGRLKGEMVNVADFL